MMQVVGWDQIKFSIEGTQELLQLNVQKNFLKKSAEELHQLTDGWVAGLVLMLETGEDPSIKPDQIKDLARQDIFSYFANEIFDW